LPFSNAVVPTVDLAAGRVVIALPEEIDGDEATAGDAMARDFSACRPRHRVGARRRPMTGSGGDP